MGSNTDETQTPHARRSLTLFDVVCIGVNATVGSGVFALPDDVYREMGGFSPLGFAVCALLLLPVSLCMAELASSTDETGGPYLYARRAFGREVGFVVGWFCWVATLVSWAAVSTLFVEIIGLRGTTAKFAAAGMILFLGAVNYVGVKPGAALVNLVTVGKLAAIFAFVGVGMFQMTTTRWGGDLPSVKQFGTGVYLTLFPLQGFEVAPVTAGETQNPRRNVPLGTIGSLVFSALLYVVVQAVLVATYPGLGNKTDTPLYDAAKYIGPTLALVVLLGSIVSTGGFTAGSALGSPRYAEAMAEHKTLPAALSRIHPRFRTPYVAIAVTALLAAGLALPFDYRMLVGVANVTVVFQYVFSCLAVPVLRKKEPLQASKWRVPGGIILPILGALGSLALLAFVSLNEWLFSIIALGIGRIAYTYTVETKKK
ncbi:MAG: APC family permease [Polyangiaceae bacterium]|nr:APC family permease [Polyangiaceae bacterium]